MQRSEFANILRDLGDFYGKSVSEKAAQLWWSKLQWLDSKDAHVALGDITSHERQMPTPGVFLQYADQAKARRAFRESQLERDSSRRIVETGNYNAGLAKECAGFVQMVYKFRPGTKEKYEFEIGWCQQMQINYPHLVSEFRAQEKEAVLRLKELNAKARENAA